MAKWQQAAIDQQSILNEKFERCLQKISDENTPYDGELYCPITWDGIYCWPNVPAGTVHHIPCPSYIHGFNVREFASRYCTMEGNWWRKDYTNETWSNYTQCTIHDPTILNETLVEPHMENIKLISKVGYSTSLATLLVAFFILAFVRKLRCPRNNLHMQLFMSFIMRSVMFLLKDALFVEGIGLRSNATFTDDVFDYTESIANVDCKIFTSFWHYFLMANYCWILMEGLYLHNLVFLAMFTDTTSILRYLILGWGLPLLFIIPWVVVRATLEDTLCWTTNQHSAYFWIIRAPITVSILVNFIFFINITRVLFMKMFASHNSQARKYRYRKWFKSTLVLVPLFGIHYSILLVMSLVAEVNKTVEVIWLYTDQLFSSYQGSFVAFLYCFLNGEVQTELKKLWQRNLTTQNLRSHHSLLSHSLTSYVSRGRSSVQSFHSTSLLNVIVPEKRDPFRSVSPVVPDCKRNQDTTPRRLPHFETNPCFSSDDTKANNDYMLEMESQQRQLVNGHVTMRNASENDRAEENDRLLLTGENNEKESAL
ncbi:parathyroid hormone/parathyroid hormone-related peptide receptor-like [Centruroides sculpturatus]|uniref:parathyroid hormone/parathyroid hormone-related peptide receptor-like n=1 Tax=Centruroides sculpturatus TaxID=218467 RepID=UPI000C6EADF3|nr:parathyroid hormone/parathyroid hormone-related peptide receptor-like [Centruroides sculpturatus]